VLEYLPGWQTDTTSITEYAALPGKARDYLAFLHQQTGVEIGGVSVGPERNQTIIIAGSKLERLLS